MESSKFSMILFLSILVEISTYGTASPLPRDTTSVEGLKTGNHCKLVDITILARDIDWARLTNKSINGVFLDSFTLQHCSGSCLLRNKKLGLPISDEYASQMRKLVKSCNNRTKCGYLSPCCVPKKYHRGGENPSPILPPYVNKTVSVLYLDLNANSARKTLTHWFLQPKDCHCQ